MAPACSLRALLLAGVPHPAAWCLPPRQLSCTSRTPWRRPFASHSFRRVANRPTLDDVLDSVALAYYSLLGLAAWKKTLLLALLVGAALVYYFLREKVEKFVLALQYAYDELKQSDPELKPWWQGWTMDWKDAYTEVWVPAMRRRAQRKQQRREAIERQRAAWALREQAEKELQKRIESGTFIGADEVAQRRGSQPPPPQAA